MSTRVSKIANVIIPAADDRALQFYTEALGLEKRADLPFGDGNGWIEVAPPGAETPIAICPPGPTTTPGGRTPASHCRPTTSTPTTLS
jgi:catechol 2,3-dioxygenase-like lactoylglutathione lyase family enzyme